MASFAPQRVHAPHHFDIQHHRRGFWIAHDRDGLIGGTFLTRKDALRFALFEAGGDSACVHLLGTGESDGEPGRPDAAARCGV